MTQGLVLVIPNLQVGTSNASATAMITAGLVAFCWGTTLRRDAVASGELGLTGATTTYYDDAGHRLHDMRPRGR